MVLNSNALEPPLKRPFFPSGPVQLHRPAHPLLPVHPGVRPGPDPGLLPEHPVHPTVAVHRQDEEAQQPNHRLQEVRQEGVKEEQVGQGEERAGTVCPVNYCIVSMCYTTVGHVEMCPILKPKIEYASAYRILNEPR